PRRVRPPRRAGTRRVCRRRFFDEPDRERPDARVSGVRFRPALRYLLGSSLAVRSGAFLRGRSVLQSDERLLHAAAEEMHGLGRADLRRLVQLRSLHELLRSHTALTCRSLAAAASGRAGFPTFRRGAAPTINPPAPEACTRE